MEYGKLNCVTFRWIIFFFEIKKHAIIASMNNDKLKIIGAMLYCCEGTKARIDKRYNRLNYAIELTNTDYKIINIFSEFLRVVIKPDWKRVKGQLFYYPDQDKNELIEYWSEKSGVPINQFHQCILMKSNPRFKPNKYGTFKIRYFCKEDYLKLQGIIDSIWRDAGVV